MGLLVTIEGWALGIEIAIVAIAVPVAATAWRAHVRWIRWQEQVNARFDAGTKEFEDLHKDILELKAELQPNGGKSFEDRMRKEIRDLASKIEQSK